MNIKLFVCALSAMLLPVTQAMAGDRKDKPVKVKNDTISVPQATKGEERNVMLNASDANKPREIQIGLPSEDVNVYEKRITCRLFVQST